jgi:hypothetical protein
MKKMSRGGYGGRTEFGLDGLRLMDDKDEAGGYQCL